MYSRCKILGTFWKQLGNYKRIDRGEEKNKQTFVLDEGWQNDIKEIDKRLGDERISKDVWEALYELPDAKINGLTKEYLEENPDDKKMFADFIYRDEVAIRGNCL